MSSVRLNQTRRETVLQKMLDHAFGVKRRELNEAKRKLASDIYDEVYPEKTRRLMKRVPAGFLPTASGFQVTFAGQYAMVYWSEERPVADRHQHRAVRAFSASDEFSVRNLEIEERERRLQEDRDKAYSAARAALGSCATVKQLVEMWPEAAPFVKDFTAPPQQRALTLSIGDLNRQLGLSPGVSQKVKA